MTDRATLRKGLAILAVLALAAASGCFERLNEIKNQRTGPGDSARDYLAPNDFTKIIIEVDYMNGAEPNSEAMAKLEAAMKDVSGKSVNLVRTGGIKGKGESSRYSFTEIEALEKEHRKHYTGGDTAVLYMLYVDGGSTEDSGSNKVLGAAYRGSSLVMFKGNVKSVTRSDGSLPLGTSPEEKCVERAVAVHELGHALGLVNNGIPMVTPHEDPDHRGHSSNERSVMFWAVEGTANLFNLFTGGCSESSGIPYKFDGNDLADMRAIREGK